MIDINDVYKKDLHFDFDIKTTPTGDISVVNGVESVRLALFRRLITSKGSIIHRPDFGVGIKDFQNGLNSYSNQTTLANLIKEEFEKDPRVQSVSKVRIKNNNSDPSLLEISISVNILGVGDNSLTFIPFGDSI